MQGLVGDAEQRAVRHAQPVALRCQRGAFHVDRDGAAVIDAPPLLRPAQFPVAVVVAHHRAGAQPPLQRIAALSGDSFGGLLRLWWGNNSAPTGGDGVLRAAEERRRAQPHQDGGERHGCEGRPAASRR